MMRASHPRAQLTQEDWIKQRGLLRFTISSGRLAGMPLLLLVYPCITFACHCDPRDLARGPQLTASEARSRLGDRIRDLVKKLGIIHKTSGSVDERWYWITPVLLDFAEFPEAVQAWWERAELSKIWAGVEGGEEDAGWSRHVEQAVQTLAPVRSEKEHLGLPPDDLFDVLGLAASAAPATATLRAFARKAAVPADDIPLVDNAARTGSAFLTLFNHAEVIETDRTEFSREPYCHRALEYAHAGGLQAVLDEYAHLLKESLGIAADTVSEMAEKISAEL